MGYIPIRYLVRKTFGMNDDEGGPVDFGDCSSLALSLDPAEIYLLQLSKMNILFHLGLDFPAWSTAAGLHVAPLSWTALHATDLDFVDRAKPGKEVE